MVPSTQEMRGAGTPWAEQLREPPVLLEKPWWEVQYSTVQYSSVQYSTVQFSAVPGGRVARR